jgi:TRAP-type mannitol/chloroaromatic compound transport system permease large subunit
MQKYRFLFFAAKVLRIVGWIVLVVGVIGSIFYGIVTGSAEGGTAAVGVLMAVAGVIVSFLAWVFLLTARELLYLFMDVEENTRNTAERITITKKSS